MDELAKLLKEALLAKNGVAVGEIHFHKEVSQFNNEVVAKEFITQAKALGRKPVLLAEDNLKSIPIDLTGPDGKTYRSNIFDFITDPANQKDLEKQRTEIAKYIIQGSGRPVTPDSTASMEERLEMYSRFVKAGGKVISLNTDTLLNEQQEDRYMALLGKKRSEQE